MKRKSNKPSLKNNISTFFKVMKYLKRYKILFILSLFFTAFVVGLTLYVPILIGQAIDLAIGKGKVSLPDIYQKLFIIAICIAITAFLQWIVNVMNNKMVYGIVKNVRKQAFKKIQSFPISYIDAHQSGDIINRIIADSDQFSDGLLMGFTQFFSGIMTIIGTLIFMLIISSYLLLYIYMRCRSL